MVVVKDYESPQIDFAKSRCSTPCKAPTVNDITDKDRPIADLIDIVTSKINEVLDEQENHMRKVTKENATPCKVTTVTDITDKDRPIAVLMDIHTSKFNEVLDEQENHMRKFMKKKHSVEKAIARSTG